MSEIIYILEQFLEGLKGAGVFLLIIILGVPATAILLVTLPIWIIPYLIYKRRH